MSENLKGTWPQALKTFLAPIFLVLVIRWAIFEPFVIPSGSMIPTLLVHDHIVVHKFSYGLKFPFLDSWIIRWSDPKPGDVVVFKFPENPDVYYIKRLIGLPGDEIRVSQGHITANNKEWKLTAIPPVMNPADSTFEYFSETIETVPPKNHPVRFYSGKLSSAEETVYKLGPHQYFFMGDNRDQSSDGRVWGFVDEKLIVGKASLIWLSCDETLPSAPFVCNPMTLRWSRFFKEVL